MMEVHDEPRRQPPYVYPSIELLNLQQREIKDTRAQDTENAGRLEKTLESFNIPAKVQRVTHGPAVTRFELGLLSSGVNVKRIMSIADNIALDLAANGGVRIEIPIPGTNLFGIEVPNREIQSVSLAEVLLSPEMKNAKSPLTVALGRDIAGKPVLCDLAKMPHLLIAGQTGSGKSVCINAIINSLLYRTSPEDVRMIMIDPKVVELQCYNVIPHLLIPVVSDPHKAAGALSWAVAEMLERYHKMQTKNVREISAYNAKLEPGEEKLPRIVIIIDELADLMLACKKDVEESIIRLAQLARAAGIHMVVATQRPTVDVITGLIKANIPSRIAFAVSSSIDSRTILDQNGAEKLLGKGDMFYFPTGASAPLRVQGCFLSDAETERVVTFIGEHSKVEFDEDVLESLENSDDTTNPLDEGGGDDSGVDDRLAEAIEMVIADGQASISMLQRRMKIGYARAGRLIDDMANRGIVSKSVGSKPREVLITREEFEKIKETLH
jgi:S-DNA-T family DNA segregation ATPase FtsK/SpoIIIE